MSPVDESPAKGEASANATTQVAPQPPRSASTPPATSPTKPSDTGSRRAWVVVGSVAAIILFIGGAALAWRPWDTQQLHTAAPDTTERLYTTTAQPTHSASPTPFTPPPPLTPARDIAGMTVMLDPSLSGGADERNVPNGRGGTVACQPPGASTPNGYPEHTINWDTTLRVRLGLTALGVRTAMTRGNDDTTGPCVDERAAMANALHPEAIVSINAYSGSPAERGFIVVYPSPLLDTSLDKPLQAVRLRNAYLGARPSGAVRRSTYRLRPTFPRHAPSRRPENFRTAGLGAPFAQVSGGQRGARPSSPRRAGELGRAGVFSRRPNPLPLPRFGEARG
jgi:N-acetylmuramoyl-L-alanine amidase